MYTQKQKIVRKNTDLQVNGVIRPGQSMEEFLRKAMQGNEPIQATAKVTYNDRKDGVLPQHDIRTDRWDLALEMTDRVHKTQATARHNADYGDPAKAPVATITTTDSPTATVNNNSAKN